VLQCVAVCCRVLQCVAVCCSAMSLEQEPYFGRHVLQKSTDFLGSLLIVVTAYLMAANTLQHTANRCCPMQQILCVYVYMQYVKHKI